MLFELFTAFDKIGRSHKLDFSPKRFIFLHNCATCSELPYDISTVCPGSSDPPEKIINIFASEKGVYTIYKLLLRYFRLNIIRLQSKIILGHMNSIG